MRKRIFFKRKKRVKDRYGVFGKVALVFAFVAGIYGLVGFFVLIPLGCITEAQFIYSALGILIVTIAIIVTIFIIKGYLPKFQARKCIEHYAFSPYTPDDETKFESYRAYGEYFFGTHPFINPNGEAPQKIIGYEPLMNYLSSIAREAGLDGIEQLSVYRTQLPDEFEQFVLVDLSEGGKFTEYVVEGRETDNSLSLRVSIHSELIFREDGIDCQEFHFDYKDIKGQLIYEYKDFLRVMVRLHLGDKFFALIVMGSKIAALIDKYGIHMDDYPLYKSMVTDPEGTFKTLIANIPHK